ncbi:PIR Superfamily Protein [Plasmodium ovale curtisi]|uniref:PIR Superfamily Protein n=2 Tax=Plasmodium ovale curtisi TaxID=864141 RepID=A0A1A8WNU4_PLAOA|nr:PIR Superfamily Protein [Plasmodium ovale curtisi]
MPLEIQTIYNAATLNDRYREKLNSLKNDRKTQNINGCREFTNQYLNIEGNEYKICEAVILFLRHLKEESAYTTFHDNGLNNTIIPFTLISFISLILPILYKFTAFGPWIRQLVFKNRNVLDNINEDINDSLQIYERENDYSKTRGYNIAYSS